MSSLESIKTEIDNVGNQIRELKSSGGGDVGALVAKLTTLKKDYADQNGGIGVDGKPYQAPLSKAEKKKLEKEKKAAAAATAAEGSAPAAPSYSNDDQVRIFAKHSKRRIRELRSNKWDLIIFVVFFFPLLPRLLRLPTLPRRLRKRMPRKPPRAPPRRGHQFRPLQESLPALVVAVPPAFLFKLPRCS